MARSPARQLRPIALLLLLVFFLQATAALPHLSLTADEPVYMGAGYALLRGGDTRMAPAAQHPPLMQELVALPLLLQPGPTLTALDGWQSAEMARFAPAFVAWYGDRLDAATFAARLPVVLVALLWAAVLYRWAADWFGPRGALVALTLFVFDPNILAHATLATTDVGFAAFSFIALFSATRLLRRPARRYLLLTGLAVGASLSAKSTGFFTVLVLTVLLPLAALAGSADRLRRLARAVGRLALILLLGLLVLWAAWGFELRPAPLATQWRVWGEMRQHLGAGHTGYLMGQIRDTGWLLYYPLAFVLKTPPLTLALLLLGLTAALVAGPRQWRKTLPAGVYLGGYTAATLLSRVNIGYRFLLPLLPFFFLLVARLTTLRLPSLYIARDVFRFTFYALLICYIITTLTLSPHYLTYFNLFAGGPAGGHRYLVDSNLDWGQSFKALRAYLEAQSIPRVRWSHYTYVDPALYGIAYDPIPPTAGAPPVLPARFNPPPGVYAIGATTLQGVMVVDPDMYSWFRLREPLARPGNAISVYRVEPQEPPPTWLAQCTAPAAPLTPALAAEGLGRDDLRLAYFDCTQSWLYPVGGESPGWYALHRDAARSDDPFTRRRLASARLSYEQRTDRQAPAFALYVQAGGVGTPPCALSQPLALDGPLDLMGYTLPTRPVRRGDTVEIETCWRVTALPARPLSLMLHLVGPDGATHVGDGLGVPVENWAVGDIIVQRHRLVLPADAPPGDYIPYTGAYWLDTLERWTVRGGEGSVGDRVALPPLTLVADR